MWNKTLVNKIIIGTVLVALVASAGISLKSYETQKQKALDDKIVALEKELSDLKDSLGLVGGQIKDVTSEQEKTDIALKELQNREVVKQKSQDELLTAAVARVTPAVVSIVISKDVPTLEVVYENPFGNDPFFKDFNIRIPVYRQKGVEHKQVGAGTGFLIAADGYILTNRHVVSDEQSDYTALLSDGSQKLATVVYRDPGNDIAIIKIDGGKYPVASLGNSDSLKLGQTVAAIGNALGQYNNSVSVGIISGVNRTIQASGETLSNVIQTDAAINLGNSGGPLLDLGGKVVGINVATVIGSNSISFSIPINAVKGLIKSAIGR